MSNRMVLKFFGKLSYSEKFKVHQAIDKVTNQWVEESYEEIEED